MKTKTIASSFGRNFTITIWGGSHEPEIGMRWENLPEGLSPRDIDEAALSAFLSRRAPGNSPLATARKEADIPERTCDDPLTYIIRNTDQRSGDYAGFTKTPRPGHADFTAALRYGDTVNMAGGGPFSGRMTAPLCIAGGIALQILERKGVSVSACLAEPSEEAILTAKKDGDSIGGRVHCTAKGLPAGIGGAMYDGLESYIAPIVFGIPGVKGLSFGEGFNACRAKGSENNDSFTFAPGVENASSAEERLAYVTSQTNHAGGILGGISTGMPIEMDVAFKPTASIAKEQTTVDLSTGKQTTLTVGGRHDPCIAVRAVPVVEAAMALGILDAMQDVLPEE